ncbi:MAG: glycosyltransferase family 9 protein [Pseudohongiellaceae bacterium]
MRPEYYRQQWKGLQIREAPGTAELTSLAERVAFTFIDRYLYSDEYNANYIELLCEMATFSADPRLNQPATGALFGIVVERLCDDFEELQTETYNRLMCQVVTWIRGLPEGAELNRKLGDFSLNSRQQLIDRIESIRLGPDEPLPEGFFPQKMLVLSRVTVGADVAITTVIYQRLRSLFPACEIVIIGNAKLRQVFAESPGARIRELHYARRGGLLERFNVWLQLLAAVNEEIAGLAENEYLLFDPDSRLTQLGVLPLVPASAYRFFNSRGKEGYPAKASISELTNLWLTKVLGNQEFCYPKLWPAQSSLEAAKSLIGGMDSSNVITINLGVGGNRRKRIAGSFEIDLVLSLLLDPATRIILDMGYGDEERQRCRRIIAATADAGYAVGFYTFGNGKRLDSNCRLLGVECDVGEIAALITSSQEFIGYDSACQHIAAAQGVRTYTLFAGSNNVKFIRRWHACGTNTSEIVFVDTLSQDREVNSTEIIARLLDLRRP